MKDFLKSLNEGERENGFKEYLVQIRFSTFSVKWFHKILMNRLRFSCYKFGVCENETF